MKVIYNIIMQCYNSIQNKERLTTYAEKLELIYKAYESTLDLDIAFVILPLSDEEREQLSIDPDLLARIAVCDARVKEDLIVDLRNLSKGAVSESVRLQALKELGRTLYPKRFATDVVVPPETNPAQQVQVYLPDNGRD